eukprot:scaffold10604_cov268-Alexandrium_tamarense.AAC.2
MTAADALDEIERLSPEERDSHYKPGSIKRVKLKNFLTYDAVEFFPGPRLNVVVGPNGTGKSTILCAICLGLGGQPPLLGRADDARLFIKHEKDEATVEIELAPLEGKPVHVFKRVIDRAKGSESGKGAGASAYFINGHKATLKDLKKIVTEVYKISIDNLCTFLPQDKVGNFSGFDKQALLIETEKSLSEHLYNTHMDLIKLEKELGDSGNNADQVQADLDEEMKQNAKLEDELKKLEEREGLIERVELLKMKRTWMIFDAKREETKLLKEMRESLKKQKKEAERGMKPIAEKHAEMEGEVNRIKSRYNTLEKKLKQDRKTFDDCNSKSANYGDAIENAMAEYQNIEAEQRRAERELEKQRARLEDLETEFKEFPDAAELEKEIAVSQRELRDTKKKIDDIKRRMRDLAEDSEVATNRRDNAARELEKVKDEKKIRLNRLFGVAKNLQEAYQFVDQNRKMFRRPVWGPVGAEVQPKSEAAAAFLEQHVSNASWKAFVVECKEDYDLLYREIRQKRKIPINIITVPVGGKLDKVDRPYSKEKFEVLKREHGFEYYLDESFTAPDAIVAALQLRHSTDKVLVGGSNVQKSIDKKDLMEFLTIREPHDSRSGKMTACFCFTSNGTPWKYTLAPSRYSGEIGTDTAQIPPAKLLRPGTDPSVKDELAATITEAEETIARVKPQLEEGREEINELTEHGQGAGARFKEAKKAKADQKQFAMKLDNQRDKVGEAEENASRDNVREKGKLIAKIKKLVETNITMSETAAKAHNECLKATRTLIGVKMTEDGLVESLRKLVDALEEKKAESADLANKYKEADQQYNEKKNLLKKLLDEAQRIAPKSDEELHEKLQADDLPTELPDSALSQLEQKLERWEASLTNIVTKVNSKFSAYMKEVGCAGEVRLYTGDKNVTENDDDSKVKYSFKNWGIEILVKFREASSLQVLSAQTHSGGERSVSTIMYLMGLQNLMSSPFRCVDEINQGLDERNERLVFKRIVQNSTKAAKNTPNDHCGQYFLITPKLLPNLDGMENENITVLFVFSGPNNFGNYLDWNVDKFIAEKRKFLTRGEGNDDGEGRVAKKNRSR